MLSGSEPDISVQEAYTRQVADELIALGQGLLKPRFSEEWWTFFWDGLGSSLWQVRSLTLATGRLIPIENRPWDKVKRALENRDNTGLRNATISLVSNWGNSALDPICTMYDQGSVDIRKYILDILKRIPGRQTYSFLKDLEEQDVNLKVAVIEAIAASGATGVVENLWQQLEEDNAIEIQLALLDALSQSPERFTPEYDIAKTKMLWQKGVLHRTLIRLYSAIGSRASIDLLIEMLPVLSLRRQREAANALHRSLMENPHLWRYIQQHLDSVFDPLRQNNIALPLSLAAIYGDKAAARTLLRDDSLFSDEVHGQLCQIAGEDVLIEILHDESLPVDQFERLASQLGSEHNENIVALCEGHVRQQTSLQDAAFATLYERDQERGWNLALELIRKHQLIHVVPSEKPKGMAASRRITAKLDHLSEEIDSPTQWVCFLKLATVAGASELIETVELGLQHEDDRVRAASGVCLAHLDVDRFLEQLPVLLTDSQKVQVEVLRVVRLRNIAQALPVSDRMWEGADPWIRVEILRCRVSLSDQLHEILEKALADGYPPLVKEALESATQHSLFVYSAEAEKLLSHTAPEVRMQAWAYLTAAEIKLSVARLEKGLLDASAAVRSVAISYVEVNRDLASPALLRTALQQESDSVLFSRFGDLLAKGF